MLVTLLTDFGTTDYFVGAMKGAVLSVNPAARVIDITHEISPHDVRAAAFTLANYYRTFPPRTVHLCVVDPGVGSERRAILLQTEDYYFIAPDNGLLSFIFENEDARVYELTNETFFRQPVSRTFHGRDVFAPVAGHLTKGIAPAEFGAEIRDLVKFETPALEINSDTIEAAIIHIDRFGNIITNLAQESLPERFILEVNGKRIQRHQNYYAETGTSELFSIMGSAGFLEIVAFRDSAKELLNVKTGGKIRLRKV